MDIVYVKMYKINVLEYILVFFIVFEKVLYLFNYDFNIRKILFIYICLDNDCLESFRFSERI